MAKKLMLIGALTLALAACGGSDDGASDNGSDEAPVVVEDGDAAKGKQIFNQTCVACHGQGGVGIEGLGKSMSGRVFITDSSDSDLATFIKVGRGPSDPENTTGVDMPPKGGNPALNDQDLADIVAYIRTLG